MSRSVSWRRTCTDAASWSQDQASNTTIYILRNLGPTSFLLKEEDEEKNFKVFPLNFIKWLAMCFAETDNRQSQILLLHRI